MNDAEYMNMALREAERAAEADEVPVGAVIVHEGRVIGRAHNQRELLQDPTAHAEMIALTQAAADIGSWRLNGCAIYVTLEPCTMCAGALVLARIDRVVFGAWDEKAGACGSVLDVSGNVRLNHNPEVIGGIEEARCRALLQSFFERKRVRSD